MTRRYTVVWSADAEADLALLWLNAAARNAIATAADTIDRRLSQTPDRHGAILAEGLYTLDEPPLRVIFEIASGDNVVRVVKVKRVDPAA